MTETCQKMERPVLGRSVFVSRPWEERGGAGSGAEAAERVAGASPCRAHLAGSSKSLLVCSGCTTTGPCLCPPRPGSGPAPCTTSPGVPGPPACVRLGLPGLPPPSALRPPPGATRGRPGGPFQRDPGQDGAGLACPCPALGTAPVVLAPALLSEPTCPFMSPLDPAQPEASPSIVLFL